MGIESYVSSVTLDNSTPSPQFPSVTKEKWAWSGGLRGLLGTLHDFLEWKEVPEAGHGNLVPWKGLQDLQTPGFGTSVRLELIEPDRVASPGCVPLSRQLPCFCPHSPELILFFPRK